LLNLVELEGYGFLCGRKLVREFIELLALINYVNRLE